MPYNTIGFITARVIGLLSTLEPHWFYHCNSHQFLSAMQPHWFYHCNSYLIFWVPYNNTSFITATDITFLSTMQPNCFHQCHHHQFSEERTFTLLLSLHSPWFFEYHAITQLLSLQRSSIFFYHTTTLVLSPQLLVPCHHTGFFIALVINFFSTIQRHWFHHCNDHQVFECHTTAKVLSMQRWSFFWVQ